MQWAAARGATSRRLGRRGSSLTTADPRRRVFFFFFCEPRRVPRVGSGGRRPGSRFTRLGLKPRQRFGTRCPFPPYPPPPVHSLIFAGTPGEIASVGIEHNLLTGLEGRGFRSVSALRVSDGEHEKTGSERSPVFRGRARTAACMAKWGNARGGTLKSRVRKASGFDPGSRPSRPTARRGILFVLGTSMPLRGKPWRLNFSAFPHSAPLAGQDHAPVAGSGRGPCSPVAWGLRCGERFVPHPTRIRAAPFISRPMGPVEVSPPRDAPEASWNQRGAISLGFCVPRYAFSRAGRRVDLGRPCRARPYTTPDPPAALRGCTCRRAVHVHKVMLRRVGSAR